MKCCLFDYHFSTFYINLLHHTRKNQFNFSLLPVDQMLCYSLLGINQNKSGSTQSVSSILYCIENVFNADFHSLNRKEVSLLLYNFLIRFLNDSRALSTTFGFGVIKQPISTIFYLLYAFSNEYLCWF